MEAVAGLNPSFVVCMRHPYYIYTRTNSTVEFVKTILLEVLILITMTHTVYTKVVEVLVLILPITEAVSGK